MTEPVKLPRLGDRKDLVIEVTPSAVSAYQQTYSMAFRSALGPKARRKTMTLAEAREELADVLLEAKVTYSAGESMTVRAVVRRLEVDVQAECTRVSPTHIRCHLAQVRRLDTRTQRAGSRAGDATTRTFRIYDLAGNKIGVIRYPRGGGPIEYRPMAEENGALAPPWVPWPEHVRALLRQAPRNQVALAEMTETFGEENL